jgi:hypothetical protein
MQLLVPYSLNENDEETDCSCLVIVTSLLVLIKAIILLQISFINVYPPVDFRPCERPNYSVTHYHVPAW